MRAGARRAGEPDLGCVLQVWNDSRATPRPRGASEAPVKRSRPPGLGFLQVTMSDAEGHAISSVLSAEPIAGLQRRGARLVCASGTY